MEMKENVVAGDIAGKRHCCFLLDNTSIQAS